MNWQPIQETIAHFAPDYGPIIAAAAWALLHFIWQGCVLASAYFCATCLLRRAGATSRYIAGCITMLMMAITPFATFVWMLQTGALESTASSTQGDALLPSGLAGPSSINSLHLGVVGTWLLGMAGCAVWVLGGWAQAQRFRSLPSLPLPGPMHAGVLRLGRAMNVRCVVRIVDHVTVAAPLTFGALKPVILLPASMLLGLSPSQLEAVIAHEMAHIRRRDFLVNLLQTAVESLLFYHPAVWWVSSQVRQEREYCCDDLAAHMCGNAIDYARALAQLESLRSDSPRLGLSSQGGSLMKRIERLIGSPPGHACSRVHATTWGLGATLTLLAAASTALAVGRPAEKPVTAEKPVFQEVPGQPLTAQGVWLLQNAVQGEAAADGVLLERPVAATDVTEGEWLAEGVELFAVAETQVAAPEAIDLLATRVRLMNLDGALFVQGAPAIDPEKMPSDGLVKAAQLAYPYNLLQLMPWVAPEAAEILVAPLESQPSILVSRLAQFHAAQRVAPDSRVPLLRALPLVPTVQGKWVEATPTIEADVIEVQGQALDENAVINIKRNDQAAGVVLRYAPMWIRAQGDVVVNVKGQSLAADTLVVTGEAIAAPATTESAGEKKPAPKP